MIIPNVLSKCCQAQVFQDPLSGGAPKCLICDTYLKTEDLMLMEAPATVRGYVDNALIQGDSEDAPAFASLTHQGDVFDDDAATTLTRELLVRFKGKFVEVTIKEVPAPAPKVPEDGSANIKDLLLGMGCIATYGEMRRLLHQGAVRIDGEVIRDGKHMVPAGKHTIEVGRRYQYEVDFGLNYVKYDIVKKD